MKNMKTNIKMKSQFLNKNGLDMCLVVYTGLILENIFFHKPLSEI